MVLDNESHAGADPPAPLSGTRLHLGSAGSENADYIDTEAFYARAIGRRLAKLADLEGLRGNLVLVAVSSRPSLSQSRSCHLTARGLFPKSGPTPRLSTTVEMSCPGGQARSA